jgi:AcrR family transcriptional regulator
MSDTGHRAVFVCHWTWPIRGKRGILAVGSSDCDIRVKTDRRTERTRQALMMAFVGEVLLRGYEDVSVEDIVKRANVGRSTFYMHYKSKDDLLRESITRPSTILSLLVGGDVTVEMLVPQLVHFHEQRHRNGTFFRDPARRLWAKRLAEMMEPRLAKIARQNHAQPVLPLALIAMQLAEAQIALVTNWLTDRPALKPDAVASAMIAATQAGVRALLGLRADASVLIPGEKFKFVAP